MPATITQDFSISSIFLFQIKFSLVQYRRLFDRWALQEIAIFSIHLKVEIAVKCPGI